MMPATWRLEWYTVMCMELRPFEVYTLGQRQSEQAGAKGPLVPKAEGFGLTRVSPLHS